VFRRFADYIKERRCDIVITGKVGVGLFKHEFSDRPFKQIKLPNRELKDRDLAALVKITKKYVNARIFCGRFTNLIKQEPVEVSMSDDSLLEAIAGSETEKERYSPFIYEPSWEEVLEYFDTQILLALLSRTVQEARLAEHGSRVTAMELARQNVENIFKKLEEQLLWERKRLLNKQQQEQFASIQLWDN